MRILFIDPVCPKPYDPHTLESEPLGGTEATVIRVAEALGRAGHEVRIAQHNRVDPTEAQGKGYNASYFPFGYSGNPTHVIVLRAPMALYQARKQFPSAKLYLWCHDIFSGEGWDKGFQAMVDTQAVPVLVSEWHKAQMYDAMSQVQFKGSIPSRRIYNPIADDLQPNADPVDSNKLVFFSSPHKGLEYTLSVFEKFQNFEELREMRLCVANPGYFENADTKAHKNVVNLGALSHPHVIQHVRNSFAVFHLNGVFPETFGLVHAEANAVGTPFLSSKMGAVPETADHPAELIDVRDTKAVIDRMRAWKTDGRPKVRANPAFRLARVIREWLELFQL
jgi:hypothetical protein